MKILGIDPGTAIVGWAVIEADGPRVTALDYGHISTEKDQPMSERLLEIRDDLRALLQKHQPDEAAVEDLFFFSNQKTVISVAQARGAILLTLADFGVKLASYTPLQVKQALTNYGRADKKQMQEMVKVLLKLPSIPKPDDTADALAIAMCHASRLRYNQLTH